MTIRRRIWATEVDVISVYLACVDRSRLIALHAEASRLFQAF